MVSQFVSTEPHPLLGDLNFAFPEGTHAIGRLDLASEGLLLLTTNGKITKWLFQGPVPHPRTYCVQVKGRVTPETAERLERGIPFTISGGRHFVSAPCQAELIGEPGFSFPSPIQYNSFTNYSWLRMTLTEGRFHQVRKMVRIVGHPCVRLVRTSICDLELGKLLPGELREMEEGDFLRALRIGRPEA